MSDVSGNNHCNCKIIDTIVNTNVEIKTKFYQNKKKCIIYNYTLGKNWSLCVILWVSYPHTLLRLIASHGFESTKNFWNQNVTECHSLARFVKMI